MAQQYLDHYRLLFDQQQQYGYAILDGISFFFFFFLEDKYFSLNRSTKTK
jgi:hypothetical protein